LFLSLGDCNSRKECNGTGGEKPVTIAEFTLHKADYDTYDLSNVDGHSIGMSIKPIDGKHERIENSELAKYNCGNPTCTFDPSKCPEELKIYDGTGNIIYTSICAAIHNKEQRERSYHLKKIFENEDTRSLVCCGEDESKEKTNKTKCLTEKWPRSTDDQRYDEVFKFQCPDAYSRPFDGQKSESCLPPFLSTIRSYLFLVQELTNAKMLIMKLDCVQVLLLRVVLQLIHASS
jgi:hypothetical protein